MTSASTSSAITAPRRRAGAAGDGPAAASSNMCAVRDAGFKLFHDVTTGDGQLYDREVDLGENIPLAVAGSNADVVNRFRAFVTSLR
jgi:hypothetical protein